MHFTKKTIKEKRSDLIKNLKSNELLRFPELTIRCVQN